MGQKQGGLGGPAGLEGPVGQEIFDKSLTVTEKSHSKDFLEGKKNFNSSKNKTSFDLSDAINLTNSMIISSGGDPDKDYEKLNSIGESETSTVYLVKNVLTDDIRAMKIIKKSIADNEKDDEESKKDEEDISNEITILRTLDHPNVLKIFEFYSTKDSYSIITEFCPRGDLFQEIVDKGPFNETYCAFVMYQILSAINHCHTMNIIHRDLKPENVLIVDKDKNEYPRIKICDFSTSKIFEKGKVHRKTVGSPYYMAPEVLEKKYNEKCDLWSCGVILYLLLGARPPFGGEDDDEVIESVRSGKYDLKSSPFNTLTNSCKDLIKKLLVVDPNKRISAQEALGHKWFRERNSKELFNNIKDEKTIKKLLNNLKRYRRDAILQEVALAYLVHNFPQMKEVVNANKLFNQLDTDGDGKINKMDLFKGLRAKTESKALEKDIEKIYNNIDMDNNGYIEYEEFVRAAVSKERFINENILKFAFRYFDKDGSGEITRDELEEIFKQGIADKNKMKEALDKIIDEVDENKDGIIQFEEFVHIMKKMLK